MVSPGDSSTPASIPPSITELPPAARALTMSPLYRMPPSAISGMSYSLRALDTSYTALSWGTPTPAMMRVVHIDPGPMPTLTPSAPFSARKRAASPVAIFPTTTSTWSPKASLTECRVSMTPRLCPCAVSMTRASTPASTSAEARSRLSAVTPMPAATRRRPSASLHALGLSLALVMSLYVTSPTKRPSASTTGSFSIL